MSQLNGELDPRPRATGRCTNDDPAAILLVGLTGNIAAGKSTVGQLLAAHGFLVIDADRLGHAVLEQPEIQQALVERFGDQVLGDDRRIDRTRLGAVVFGDAQAREFLNHITHPRIRAREQESVAAWSADHNPGIAVTEAALLVETGGASRYHRLVVVTADDELRLERLAQRGLDAEHARRRMDSQMAQHEKVKVADYLIDNSRTLQALATRVDDVVESLRRDLEALVAGTDADAG